MIVVTELTKRIVKSIGEDEEIRLVLGVLFGFKLLVGYSSRTVRRRCRSYYTSLLL